MTETTALGGGLVAGRYRLIRTLGAGGMGQVWFAHDVTLDRAVAVKRILTPSEQSDEQRAVRVQRAFREARNAARVSNHPNIVTVHDVVEENGLPWIVMEYVPCRSLAERIAEHGALPAGEVARIGRSLLDALVAVHGASIVHRDIKPANVLLSENGQVLLTDFGIAVAETDMTMTSTGAVIATPEYMAPERADGHPASAASDVFSLGATLYEAAEGISPFRRDTPMAMLKALVFEEPRQFALAGPLGPLLYGLLAKDPQLRPTAAQARNMFDGFAKTAASAMTAPVPIAPPTMAADVSPVSPAAEKAGDAGRLGKLKRAAKPGRQDDAAAAAEAAGSGGSAASAASGISAASVATQAADGTGPTAGSAAAAQGSAAQGSAAVTPPGPRHYGTGGTGGTAATETAAHGVHGATEQNSKPLPSAGSPGTPDRPVRPVRFGRALAWWLLIQTALFAPVYALVHLRLLDEVFEDDGDSTGPEHVVLVAALPVIIVALITVLSLVRTSDRLKPTLVAAGSALVIDVLWAVFITHSVWPWSDPSSGADVEPGWSALLILEAVLVFAVAAAAALGRQRTPEWFLLGGAFTVQCAAAVLLTLAHVSITDNDDYDAPTAFHVVAIVTAVALAGAAVAVWIAARRAGAALRIVPVLAVAGSALVADLVWIACMPSTEHYEYWSSERMWRILLIAASLLLFAVVVGVGRLRATRRSATA